MLAHSITLSLRDDGPGILASVVGDAIDAGDIVGIYHEDFEGNALYAFLYLIGLALVEYFRNLIASYRRSLPYV